MCPPFLAVLNICVLLRFMTTIEYFTESEPLGFNNNSGCLRVIALNS